MKVRPSFPVILIGVTVLFRLVYLLQIRGNPFFDHPIMDEAYHDLWAREIASGDLTGRIPFFRAPFYPALLGLIYRVVGSEPLVVRAVHLAWGVATPLLVLRLGHLLLPRPAWAARAAALLVAFDGVLVHFEGDLLLESLLAPLAAALALLLARAVLEPTPRRWLGVGLCLGLFAITRPNILAFAPFAFLFAGISGEGGFRRFRPALRRSFALTLGVLLPVLPITALNGFVGGDRVLVSSQAGFNFFLGNNAEANGWSATAPSLLRTDWWGGYEDSIRIPEEETGRSLRPSEVSGYWFRRSLDWWRTEPRAALGLTVRKILLLFTGTELANNRNLELFLREYAPLSAWSLGLAWILFPLAVVGAVRLVRRREGSIVARPVVVMAGVYALTIAAFFVTARYRVPLRPLAALFAVAGAIGLWEGLRSRSVAGLLPWVAFAGVLVAANGNSTVREVRAGLSPGQFFQSAAEVQAETGDFSRAAALQRRALEEDRALPDGFMNLGALLQQAGDPTGAIVAFRAEAARNPGNGRNLASLARVLDRQGEHEEAERIYAAAERTGWEDPPALFGHALVLDRMGRTDEAAELYRKVVELDPSHADAWNSLGVAEARAGRLEEAMALWNRALEAQPGFPRALDNLERARRRLEAPTR